MKRVVIIAAILANFLNASSINAEDIFNTKCLMCHTNKKIDPSNKANLIGPPADEVMMHVKENFKDKDKAIDFMVDYIFNPDAKKALCASMDKFGLMPSQKGIITKDEAIAVSEYMYEKFPREDFAKKEKKNRENAKFDIIDTNKDGFISPEEFKVFRAKKNGIDVSKFKNNLFFQKIDLNGDGKMSKEEFEKFRESKRK